MNRIISKFKEYLKKQYKKIAPSLNVPPSQFVAGINDGADEIDFKSRNGKGLRLIFNKLIAILSYLNVFCIVLQYWSSGFYPIVFPVKRLEVKLVDLWIRTIGQNMFLNYFCFLWIIRYMMMPSIVSYNVPQWVRWNVVQSLILTVTFGTLNYVLFNIFGTFVETITFSILRYVIGTVLVTAFIMGWFKIWTSRYWKIPGISEQVSSICQKYY